ncbi:hypothetical protein [Myxococcus sp. RHSTA-1-4]|uniref:hypothetical protein n=1 Tax=Myxococcus sp. RHSTA-1-4 TaxID=2874601 RepID=UPI001CBC70A2|nr:hypothetical protein [Myxococcus sp. RHSTA-1-4]MBZ4418843.1 hypothetical protein [Myxococcus sp. RHSTA-1-4]
MVVLLENGARRGAEVRCPSCTRFNAPGSRCSECGCGPVPPERYGAARMLLQAGVDRFALAERVATLEPALADTLERQYAGQWARVLRILRDVRRCEPDLLLPGFSEEVEDRWALRLPASKPPGEDEPSASPSESLEELHRRSTDEEVRWLAALAEVNRGHPSPVMLSAAMACLHLHDEDRFGLEAALALTRWRVFSRVRLGREQRERIQRRARILFADHPELGARAAVAWVRARGREPDADMLFALRQGLRGQDADLRFECALCLENEAGLLAALDSSDTEVVREARRTLAGLGSPPLVERLSTQGDAGFARDVLSRLPVPAPPGALAALLAVSSRVEGGLASELHAWARGQSFAVLSTDDQALWATWARETLSTLSAEDALRFLDWAAAAPGAERLAPVRAFVAATAEALERETPSGRASLFKDAFFTRFLALAGAGEALLLHRWAREAGGAEPLLDALVSLPGRLDRWDVSSEGRAARLLMAAWEPPAREQLLAPLAKAVKSWSGISGREELIDAVWQRFQRHPEERAELLTAFMPWRQSLWERQLAAEPDPVSCFEAWWRADEPVRLPVLVDTLVREAPVEALPRRLAFVWAAAESRVDAWPRSTSHAVFNAAAALCNTLREGHDALIPEVERFLSWFPGFERRVRAAPVPEGESSYHRDLLEDLHVEVRMMKESLDRWAEAEARRREAEAREREAELQRVVEASRRRDRERQAEAARRDAERQREALAGLLSPSVEPISPPSAFSPRPRVPGRPIDDEVIFPGARLRTLMDYARLLKAMSGSSDVLAVFAAHGLTVESWTAEATAWGQAMTGRMELGLRFAELMAAPWA